MRISKRGTAGIAVAAVVAGTLTGTATTASAASAAHIRVITARMTKSAIHLSVGHAIHAGTVEFKVVSADGKGHELQLARLHRGYTLQQAGSDINKAFRGDIAAIRRVDHNITFRGGSPARPGRPGHVTVTLNAGRYYAFDQNGAGLASIRVRGIGTPSPVAHRGWITAHTYGFENSRLTNSGVMRVNNISDQPHFVVMQRVKPSTTRRQVARVFNRPPSNKQPGWVLRANTDSAVISPYHFEYFRYDLPRGKYLLACFWPDDDTGMPHAYMGMWKLVRLH
ncbi:MAG TPA: hypothetical protein VFH38_11535 [Jatrophihabitans sp.]|nr:hypothetical protein [Jatrophihabitans sp.]